MPHSMPRFFRTAGEFRSWLAKHAGTERELIVGFRELGRAAGVDVAGIGR